MVNSLKRRKAGGKRYMSGYLVHPGSLNTLRCREEFFDFMERAGLLWLTELEPITVPMCLCDEFFTSFDFDYTTDLNKVCIRFRLFNEFREMSLHEWSIRLGLYTVEDVRNGVVDELVVGVPNDEFRLEENKAWGYLTGSKEQYHSSRAHACNIIDPVLRMCHVFLVTNVLGTSTAYSRVPNTVLYMLWCIVHKRKIHLGFWIAHCINSVSHSPHRHLTLCHFLAKFAERNLEFEEPQPLAESPHAPSPHWFDLEFLRNTGIIHFVGDMPKFYKHGEDPTTVISKSSSGKEAKSKEVMDKRLKNIEKKMEQLSEKQQHQSTEQGKALKNLQADLAKLIGQLAELTKLQAQPKSTGNGDEHEDDPHEEEDVDAGGKKEKKRAPRQARGR